MFTCFACVRGIGNWVGKAGILIFTLTSCDNVGNGHNAQRARERPRTPATAERQHAPMTVEERGIANFLIQHVGVLRANENHTARASIRPLTDTGLVLVYLQSRGLCGSGGCSLIILRKRGASYSYVSRTMRVHLPVRLLHSRRIGHPVFGVWVAGGGIISGYEQAIAFDGTRYPRWPEDGQSWRTEPGTTGTVLISREDQGIPLY